MGWRHLFHIKHVQPDSHVYETFEALEALVKGAQKRRASVLGRASDRDLFEKLSRGQSPDSFSICCADSRVTSPSVFGSRPGAIFTHENVGNQVLVGTATDTEHASGYKGPYGNDPSMLASLEFALMHLKVRHILVLGHTQCGAMGGAIDLAALPYETVRNWLVWTRELNTRIDTHYDVSDKDARALAASQENVLMQMERLHRHPLVAERVARQELAVFGFVYELNNYGVLSGWDPERKRFVAINARKSELPKRKSS